MVVDTWPARGAVPTLLRREARQVIAAHHTAHGGISFAHLLALVQRKFEKLGRPLALFESHSAATGEKSGGPSVGVSRQPPAAASVAEQRDPMPSSSSSGVLDELLQVDMSESGGGIRANRSAPDLESLASLL